MTMDSAWLSISQAAKFLGVHISTLRRWSDQSLIEHVRTPGGKRKFQKESLVTFINQHSLHVKETNDLAVFQDQAISRTRQQLHTLNVNQTPWFSHMTDEQRLHLRTSGSRLVALMMHYSASSEKPEIFMEEAMRITREYGRVCRTLGVDMTECVQTFLMFRQPILNAIHETGTQSSGLDQQGFHLFAKLNHFLDVTMVAMIDEYQKSERY